VFRIGVTDHAVSPLNQLTGVFIGDIKNSSKNSNWEICAYVLNKVKLSLGECVVQGGCSKSSQKAFVFCNCLWGELSLKHSSQGAMP
jgi:hypothetical protein